MIRMANEHPIVLFDGVCNLCNRSVQFIIQHDPQGRFRFASLQSELGAELRVRLGIDPQAIDSIILIEGDRWYRESDAALRIARGLSGAWKMPRERNLASWPRSRSIDRCRMPALSTFLSYPARCPWIRRISQQLRARG